MAQEPISITYQHPDHIDGTPAQVARTALEQLDEIAPALNELLQATARQVRNAALDEIVDPDKPDAAAARELNEWEQGIHGRRLDLLEGIGARLPALAAALRKAV